MHYVKLFALTVMIILFIAHLNSRSCFRDRLMSKYMKGVFFVLTHYYEK